MHFIEVPLVNYDKLRDDRLGEPSAEIRVRVEATREQQRGRFENLRIGKPAILIACNADMRSAQIRQYCQLGETSYSPDMVANCGWP
jgi:magnesium chelatase family protein